MSDSNPEKRAKRTNAEDSVFYRTQRSGWYVSVSAPDGSRVVRRSPKQTERGAEQFLRQILSKRDTGELTRGATTLSHFKEEWLRVCKRRGLRQTSLDSYRQKMELYVEPTLGRKRLDRITTGDIEVLYDRCAEAGLSAASIAAIHVRLHNMLELARRRKLVGQVVTELVDPPRVEKDEARTLSLDELRSLHAAVAGHRYGPFRIVMAETGARFGQVAGLRLADVDLARRVARSR